MRNNLSLKKQEMWKIEGSLCSFLCQEELKKAQNTQ